MRFRYDNWIGSSLASSLGGGLILLMSMMGCAHKPPSQAPTSGSPSVPSATSADHDQSPNAASSKNPADNTPVAKPQSGGIGEGTKTAPPLKGGAVTGKGQPRAPVNGPIGLKEIEQRLRDTHAIGVFTKLSLKNQIDDLLAQLRAYQLKKTGTSLPQLRQRYDVLLQKVIGLLQSGDPSLAKDISSSREAIWSLLTAPPSISQL